MFKISLIKKNYHGKKVVDKVKKRKKKSLSKLREGEKKKETKSSNVQAFGLKTVKQSIKEAVILPFKRAMPRIGNHRNNVPFAPSVFQRFLCKLQRQLRCY